MQQSGKEGSPGGRTDKRPHARWNGQAIAEKPGWNGDGPFTGWNFNVMLQPDNHIFPVPRMNTE
jgi:hypothetical protein